MIRHFFSKQFLIFLVTGGIAAAVNFGSRFVYNHWTSFSTAVVLAYITGMITAFILAKVFVFKQSKRRLTHSAFAFTVVNAVALAQTWAVSVALAQFMDHAIAHLVGILVPVFTSYLGHKYYTFS